MFFIILYIIC